MSTKLTQILEALEDLYGPQKLVGPKDPYEMIVFLNSGYPGEELRGGLQGCKGDPAHGIDAKVRSAAKGLSVTEEE